MPHPTLPGHRKFRHLVRLLNLPEAHCLGLYCLVELAAHHDARPEFRGPGEFEASAGWSGRPGRFAAAMVAAGLAERGPRGVLALHDYWTWAPDYVRKRRARAADAVSAERRTTADNGGQRRTTAAYDLDPDLSSGMSTSRSRSAGRDRDRDAIIPFPDGGAAGKTLGDGPESAGAVLQRLAEGYGGGGPAKSGRRPRVDLGAATAGELAEICARLERGLEPERAKPMWRQRVARLELIPGGLDGLRKLLANLRETNGRRGTPAGERIANPAAYLNAGTRELLGEGRKRGAK